jgi:hypothetical protein
MQNLNQSILLNLVIGLPPVGEQRRIVAKVDEVMALCDRLEVQLNIAPTERRGLLEATLNQALDDKLRHRMDKGAHFRKCGFQVQPLERSNGGRLYVQQAPQEEPSTAQLGMK